MMLPVHMAKPAATKTKYAAFLRSINVGGNHPVPMPVLKKLFEQLVRPISEFDSTA